MKIILSIFWVMFVFISCHISGGNKNAVDMRIADTIFVQTKKNVYTKFEFSKEMYNFGEIIEGEVVICNFYYKNVGNSDLIINQVETSCGCTAVDWDKSPLPPKGEGKITVEFNSAGRYGKQYKMIYVFANVPEKVKELRIIAEVK